MPADVAEIEVAELDDVAPAAKEVRHEGEEEARLLDEVRLVSNQPADHFRESRVARDVLQCVNVRAGHRGASEDRNGKAQIIGECRRELGRERLESSTLSSKSGAREIDLQWSLPIPAGDLAHRSPSRRWIVPANALVATTRGYVTVTSRNARAASHRRPSAICARTSPSAKEP